MRDTSTDQREPVWLLLDFEGEAHHEHRSGEGGFGYKMPGEQRLRMRLIDASCGKVAELTIEAKSVKSTERPALWGELHRAQQVLGNRWTPKPDVRVRKLEAQLGLAKAKMDDLRRGGAVALQRVKELSDALEKQRKEADKLLDPSERNLVASALDEYAEYLVRTSQVNSYEVLKVVYERLVGTPFIQSDAGGETPESADDSEDARQRQPQRSVEIRIAEVSEAWRDVIERYSRAVSASRGGQRSWF